MPQSGAARLSKNIVSKDNKSIAAKHGSLSFARNRTSPFGADMPQSVISRRPTLSHNRAISPRHRPPPQCGGGGGAGKSIDTKSKLKLPLFVKRRCSLSFSPFGVNTPLHSLFTQFLTASPSTVLPLTRQAAAKPSLSVWKRYLTKNTYPPPGRPTPQSAVGRPEGEA